MSNRRLLWCAVLTTPWILACAGAAPPPPPADPAEAVDPPRPAAPAAPAGALAPWQEPFAARTDKDVLDHYMLLPKGLFECEFQNGPDTEAERRDRLIERHVADGFLTARADGNTLQVALFRDRRHERKVIGAVINAGLGDMCSRDWFAVWDDAARSWTEVDVVPRARIDEQLPPDTAWWLALPKDGTDTPVVGADGEVLLTLQWSGGRFVLPR
jgi:hypothetical protein